MFTLVSGIVIASNQDIDVYTVSKVCDIQFSKITNMTPSVGYTTGGHRVIVTSMRSGSDWLVRAWNSGNISVTVTIVATISYKD